MEKKLKIKLINKKAEIEIAQKEITKFCEKYNLSEKLKLNLNIIIDEMVTNTIQYAYDDKDPHEIMIDLILKADRLIIYYIDDGKKFDPTKSKTPSHLAKDLHDKPIGGLGIYLVKNISDNMIYKRCRTVRRYDNACSKIQQ